MNINNQQRMRQAPELTIDLIERSKFKSMRRSFDFFIIEMISKEILIEFPDVTLIELKSNLRKRYITETRQLCMYFLCECFGYKRIDVGNYFGQRDHSTVHHGIETVKDLYKTDFEFREKFEIVYNGVVKKFRVNTHEWIVSSGTL